MGRPRRNRENVGKAKAIAAPFEAKKGKAEKVPALYPRHEPIWWACVFCGSRLVRWDLAPRAVLLTCPRHGLVAYNVPEA